jgi:RNA-binding signal recognition particle 68
VQVDANFRANEAHAFARSKAQERGARPEDAVRLYDGLHRAALALERSVTAPGMPPAAAQALAATSSASAELFAAGRGFCVAQLRLGRGEAPLAAALLAAAAARLEEAEANAQGLDGPWAEGGLQRRLHGRLGVAVDAYQVIARAQAVAQAEKEDGALAAGVAGVSLEGGAAGADAAPAAGTYAERNLGSWESFVAMPGCKSRLFQLASLLERLSMRPVSLDTAQQFIEEPDVAHRCGAAAKGDEGGAGVMQGLKRMFGWRR